MIREYYYYYVLYLIRITHSLIVTVIHSIIDHIHPIVNHRTAAHSTYYQQVYSLHIIYYNYFTIYIVKKSFSLDFISLINYN